MTSLVHSAESPSRSQKNQIVPAGYVGFGLRPTYPGMLINAAMLGMANAICHPSNYSILPTLTRLALVLRKELLDRLSGGWANVPHWQSIIDGLLDLSAVEVDQDGRRALMGTAPRPSIDPICRALRLTLPPSIRRRQQKRQSNSKG